MNEATGGLLGIKTSDGRIVEVLAFGKADERTTVFTTVADRQRRARFEFYFRAPGDGRREERVPAEKHRRRGGLRGVPPARHPGMSLQSFFEARVRRKVRAYGSFRGGLAGLQWHAHVPVQVVVELVG